MDINSVYDYDELVGRASKDLPTRMIELLPLVVQYPIQCTARTLMQLGHEPMPARRYWWMGQEHLGLPSGVAYARFIYNAEGFAGMYRGFPAKCVEELTKGYVKDTVYPSFAVAMGASLAPVPPNEQFTARHLNRFVNDLAAEFVGKEDTYPDVVRGLLTLVRETDAADFREALIPMLIREALSAACWVLARHVVAYIVPVDRDAIAERRLQRLRRRTRPRRQRVVQRAAVEDLDDDGYFKVEASEVMDIEDTESEESEHYSDDDVQEDLDDFLVSQQGQNILQGMVHMVPSPYTYPFLHCATRMCVMNSGLLAASPAYMSRYRTWQGCLASLYAGGRSLAYMGSRLLTIRNVPESQANLAFVL